MIKFPVDAGHSISFNITGLDALPTAEKVALLNLLAHAIKDPTLMVVSNYDYSIEVNIKDK